MLMDNSVQRISRRTYMAPLGRSRHLCYEHILCNLSSGAGREDVGNLGGGPEWDPED